MPQDARKAAKGEFKFPKGELVSLGELVERANSAFPAPMTYDSRLAGQYVFIQGNFTQESLVESLLEATRLVPWTVRQKTLADLRVELIGLMAKRLPPNIDRKTAPIGVHFEDTFAGRSVMASNLLGSFPDLGSMLKGYDIDSSASLTLSPALTFQLVGKGGETQPDDPPGSSPLGNSWSATFGMP